MKGFMAVYQACGIVPASLAILLLINPGTGTAQMLAATSFSVNNGSANYSIPIELPAGQSGIAPQLALTYNSNGGNGPFGMGWQLSGLSSITRCPQTPGQDGVATPSGVQYSVVDRYCLDGQRLVLVSGTEGSDGAEYRTESESFSKITVIAIAGVTGGAGGFTVKTGDGTTTDYGRTADSRIELHGTTVVSEWLVNRVYDSVGNYYTIEYTKNPDSAFGSYFPSVARWGGNLTTNAPLTQSIAFGIVPRNDKSKGYVKGTPRRQEHLINVISVSTPQGLFKRYPLTYSAAIASGTGQSLLTEAQECNSANACRRIGAFDYSQTGSLQVQSLSWSLTEQWGSTAYARIADFNGDGLSDIATPAADKVYLKLSTGTGFVDAIWPVANIWNTAEFTWVGDFNGDGRPDFASASGGNVYMKLSKSTGDGFDSQTWPVNGTWGDNGYFWVADFNGDGKEDIASATDGNVYMKLSTGSGFTNEIWPVTDAWGWASYTWLGDFNGDGKPDIASADHGNVYMKLSVPGGNGFTSETWAVDDLWGVEGYFWVGDFNGDGLTDIASAANGNVYIKLSTGTGFVNEVWPVDNLWGTAAYTRLDDFNGDGLMDIASALNGNIYVKYSTGTGFRSVTYSVDANWGWADWTWVSDFDGDGRADFATALGTNMHVKLFKGPDTTATSFTNLLGHQTSVVYKTLSEMYRSNNGYGRDVTPTAPLSNVIPPSKAVSLVITSNGLGGSSTVQYSYANLLFDNSPLTRGSLGYQWIQSVDWSTGLIDRTYYFQGWPKTGLVEKKGRGLRGVWNNLMETVNSGFICNALSGTSASAPCGTAPQPGRRYFLYPQQIDSRAWDYTGLTENDGVFLALPRTRTTQQLDAYGNTTYLRTDTLNPDGSTSGYSKTTQSVYEPVDLALWHLGRLLRSTVTATSP